MTALTEVQAAARLGFGRFGAFQRALAKGEIPAPDQKLSDGPRWSESTIENWLKAGADGRNFSDEEKQLIGRFENGKAA